VQGVTATTVCHRGLGQHYRELQNGLCIYNYIIDKYIAIKAMQPTKGVVITGQICIMLS
jgi:hypothetical protein